MIRAKKIKKTLDQRFITYVIYALLIVILGNFTNYVLGIRAVGAFFSENVSKLGLDNLYHQFLYITEPYLHLERLEFLKNWLWMVSFLIFSLTFGMLHPLIFEKRLNFKQISIISALVLLFHFVKFSFPYHVYPMFLFFISFVKNFYIEPVLLFPACFISLFAGTEIILIWVKNGGEKFMKEKYLK